jgi:ribosomal protein L3
MKRWHFKGLPATHGTSLAHRSAGSTGQNQVCLIQKTIFFSFPFL